MKITETRPDCNNNNEKRDRKGTTLTRKLARKYINLKALELRRTGQKFDFLEPCARKKWRIMRVSSELLFFPSSSSWDLQHRAQFERTFSLVHDPPFPLQEVSELLSWFL